MMVNELVQRAGVTAHAVRYYVKAGLLKPKRNLSNRYKQFANGDVGRIRFVRRARQLGFTLAEIAEIFRTSGRRQSQLVQPHRRRARDGLLLRRGA